MSFFLLFLSLVLLALSTTPLLSWQSTLIDLPSHFVLQYFIAGIFLLLLCLVVTGGSKALPALILSLILNAAQLAPHFLPGGNPTLAPGTRLSLLEANILRFNADPAALHDLITTEKPDFVVVSELNSTFARMLEGIKAEYPYQKLIAKDDSSFGIGVISRLPFKNMTEAALYNVQIPSLHFSVTLDGQDVDIVAMHAANPLFDLKGRDAEFDALIKQRTGLSSSYLLVTGDLNATPYCMAFKRFVRGLNLRSAAEGRGIFGTFHSAMPTTLLRLPIDHVLIGSGLAADRYRLGTDINSDHLPVLTTLGFVAAESAVKTP